jgi:hypothetical protein
MRTRWELTSVQEADETYIACGDRADDDLTAMSAGTRPARIGCEAGGGLHPGFGTTNSR